MKEVLYEDLFKSVLKTLSKVKDTRISSGQNVHPETLVNLPLLVERIQIFAIGNKLEAQKRIYKPFTCLYVKCQVKKIYASLARQKKACAVYRSSHPVNFLMKGFLKICSKFTEEHPC